MNRCRLHMLFGSTLLVLQTSCINPPKPLQNTPLQTPSSWTAEGAWAAETPEAWLNDFDSPRLLELVDEALRNNPDIEATAARFNQAVAEAQLAGAPRQPSVSLGLDGNRQQINTFGPQSTGGVRFENYQLGLNISWELDLWARLGNQKSAALFQVSAAESDLQAARHSLAAQVVKAWFSLIEASQQTKLAEKTLSAYNENLRTLEERFQRGLSGGLDLRLLRIQAANSAAELEARRAALNRAARSLEQILGRYPSADLQTTQSLPGLATQIPAGLPSELITRRPDLIAAESRLRASEQELKASSKERLPQFSLTASGGTASQDFENLLDRNFSVWALGGNLAQPIFQGGRIRANIDRRQTLRQQAEADYRRVTLRAFFEVESCLAAESFLNAELRHLAQASTEATKAETLAWDRYRQGTIDFLVLLDAQRSASSAESRHLSLRNQILKNRIDLYLALGGPF